MADAVAPRPISQILALPGFDLLARLALASPFLISGVMKLLDFEGAMTEVAGMGLGPAGPFALAVIITQIGGSLLFLTRRYCWLGAGILAGFTIVATLLAHPFWAFEGPDRGRQTATFFEHVVIVGGFAMAVLSVNGRSKQP
ncbi:DoxX family protein [Microvirga sp. G4-2]|uniref:DoxX family protein n=1 Tax=Microvirga sp. G4-2 TaxID=3434467 RepID=UPI004044B058